ncbi:hypothetical protein [Streptomyces sp. NBC_01803]|uniref:hypothetical protein n=1 Tax=Streptomyces sp. NBC_01803 TaxID=2975946 RepID=UPI002DD82A0C|nr:hypothetical protein [Streptomyces sp. NBC_01803]WSA45518.1 hypothetical protein OIE51_15715 [Streptomyces sp. NBC_01803]
MPDHEQATWGYPKRAGEKIEFDYPLLRLLVLVECGTRALLAARSDPSAPGNSPTPHSY